MEKLVKRIFFVLIFMASFLFGEDQEYISQPVSEPIVADFENSYDEDLYYVSLFPAEDQPIIKSVHYKYQIPVKYLYRLVYIESKFNAKAVRYETNGTKSIGYMQLNSSNQRYFEKKFNGGESVSFYNKRENIKIGAAYLRHLYDRLGNWQESFYAFNCGVGRVLRNDIPLMSYEYGLVIFHGEKYLDQVEVIKGAVAGII